MHFARLANTLLKDDEGARDNHVLAHESVASLCWPILYMQNNLNQTYNNHANTSLLDFYRPGALPDAIYQHCQSTESTYTRIYLYYY